MDAAMNDSRTSSSAILTGRRPGRLGPDSLSAIAEDTRNSRGVASDTDPSSGATHPVEHTGSGRAGAGRVLTG